MIAVDTSSLISFVDGSEGSDTEAIASALDSGAIVLPPPVLTECLSATQIHPHFRKVLFGLHLLETNQGFWSRAGILRSTILAKKFKARLGDVLIAQACIDHGVPLITRDQDFRIFEKLKLLKVIW